MVYQDRVNAVITVGHKKSGQFLAKEDIDLLTTLASQGAVSIENAKLAEQMKKEETVRTNLSRYLSPQIVEGIVKSETQRQMVESDCWYVFRVDRVMNLLQVEE